jgi:hypothetical protein
MTYEELTGDVLKMDEQLRAAADKPEALAEPRPDCGALKLSDQLAKKVDEAVIYTVNELDQLMAEIEKMKIKIIAEADVVKEALANHFKLSAEALAFRENVSKRLDGLTK